MLASDAHDPLHRPPLLSAGRNAAAHWVGEEEADRLVLERPAAVLADEDPDRVTPPLLAAADPEASAQSIRKRPAHQRSWLQRMLHPMQ